MANDDKPSSSDKGKEKVDDIRELNGEKKEDKSKTDKDGKPTTNGKKDDDLKEGKEASPSRTNSTPKHPPTRKRGPKDTTNLLAVEELNEEDQQLKNDLEMLVERLQVCYLRFSQLILGLTSPL